ncbi:GNAT family N-acetyltransferase [Pseudomonas sp. G166]|uniref:GNAT family N-acetyltransferase n=1 Tax=Pseudomonas sp. G166 TaxID=3094846 RepID=UPI00300A313B
MSDIQIRLAEQKDVDALGVLFDAYRQFYRMEADLQRATSYIRARIEKGESQVFVAENASKALAGFCQLYPTFCSVFTARIFTLYDLFVDSNLRQQGIGRKLLTAAEEYARQQGAVRLDLRTAKTNESAQALYESAGWQRDEMFFSYSKFLEKEGV